MKKRTFRLFAIAMAVVTALMSATFAQVFADGEDTQVSPEILLFRDYEDYTGGSGYLNSSYKYGSLNLGTSGQFSNAATAVNRAYGTGMRTAIGANGTGYATFDTLLTNPITSGKVYIAYDVQRKSNAAIAEEGCSNFDNGIRFNKGMKNASGSEVWFYPTAFRTNSGGGINQGGLSSWQWGSTDPVMEENKIYHVETIVDMDTWNILRYVDGVKKRDWSFESMKDVTLDGNPFAIYKMGIFIGSAIEYFDNLTIIHYPTGTINSGSIAVKDAGFDMNKNSLLISLKRDVSSTATISETVYNHSASYGESVDVENLKNTLTVTDEDGNTCNVKSVSTGRISGEYEICLENELAEDKTYTVALSGTESIVGTPLSATENSADIYISPRVYFDYDFENGIEWTLGSGAGANYCTTSYDSRYGNFESVQTGKTAKVFLADFPEAINSGVKGISFDYMFKNDGTEENPVLRPSGDEYISFYNSAGTRKYLFYMGSSYGFMLGKNNVADWGDSTKVKSAEFNTLYHVDVVMDYDNLTYTGYVNGEQFASSTLSATGNEIKQLLLNQSATGFFDNYRLAVMDDTSFDIDLVTKRDSLYEVKLSEGLSAASAAAITPETLTVTNASTGQTAAVKSVEAVGRRVIFDFSEPLDERADYVITLPENLTNVIGTTLQDTSIVLEGKRLRVEKVEMKKADGTVIADGAQIADGETVKLSVTYRNTSDEAISFKVLGAMYGASEMSDAVMADVEAAANMTEPITSEYEFTLENGADAARLSCFVWDSMNTIKPLIKNASATVNPAN